MNSQDCQLQRRKFLKKSAALTATAVAFGANGSALLAETTPVQKTLVTPPSITLINGESMPILGFGTNTLNGDSGAQHVADAISVGYRLIDTAHIYGNEESVGKGIKMSGIDRKELFLTSKLWIDDAGYEQTKKGFETSIKKLGVDYLDLYLIHRPQGDVKGSWKAMEELYDAGKIKTIGVSNFEPKQLEELKAYANIEPAINQIETNVFFQEKISYPYLKSIPTQMQAWSPFAAGRNGIFENKVIAAIAKRLAKSNAQICLRWQFQRGVVAIPRSSQKAHMIENLNIFDFELTDADMSAIKTLDLNITQFPEWT